MLNYLTDNNKQSIESFHLQIFCEYIEELVIENGYPTIIPEYIGDKKNVEGIFENYYLNKIESLGDANQQLAARKLIEEELIFEEEERRLSLYRGQIIKVISPKLLERLVESRLLNAEQSIKGGYTYELSHDTLVAPILKAKAKRIEEERIKDAVLKEREEQRKITERQEKERIKKKAKEEELRADREKQRADRERRLRIRANTVSIIAGGLLLVALTAGGFAFYQKNEANKAKIEAERERDKAQEQYQQRINLEINNIIKDTNKLIGVSQYKQARSKLNEAYKLDSTNIEVKKLLKSLK